jgi:hypothetical protein
VLARPNPLVEVGSGSSSYAMGLRPGVGGLTYLSMTTAGVWLAMIAEVGAAHESGCVEVGCAALVRIGEVDGRWTVVMVYEVDRHRGEMRLP